MLFLRHNENLVQVYQVILPEYLGDAVEALRKCKDKSVLYKPYHGHVER